MVLAAPPARAEPRPYRLLHGDILRRLESPRARLLAPPPSAGQLAIDVLHYDLDVAVFPDSGEIDGTVAVTVACLAAGLDSIDLDLDPALAVLHAREADGPYLPYVRRGDRLTVRLAAPLAAGEETTIVVTWTGRPADADEPGLFFSEYVGEHLVFTLSQPWSARAWWPCKDVPEDKATFDLSFAVPPGHTAASNGVLVGTRPDTCRGLPRDRWDWSTGHPMAVYLASLASYPYTTIEDAFPVAPGDTMPVVHYVFPTREWVCRQDFSITVPVLEFFSSIFGPYPFPDEKYGAALVDIGGGMEHQTLTSYGWRLTTGTHRYDWVFVHETAHQWFGDAVTCEDWTQIWLNEGFASYAEALWFEHVDGTTALRDYMDAKDRPDRWNGPVLRDPDVFDPMYYFDDVVYNKAAWVLHMLRHVIGDEAFFGALRDWVGDPRYRYGTGRTEEFRAICEARYGHSLGWFFEEWLVRDDRLQVRWDWSQGLLGGGAELVLAVSQLQPATYTMPFDCAIETTAGTIVERIWISSPSDTFTFTLDRPAIDVRLDDGHHVLCDRIDGGATAARPPRATALRGAFPNPCNPSTTIRFHLGEACRADLRLYDVRGALVRTLLSERVGAGAWGVTWDGRNDAGRPLAAGVYFCRLRAAGGEFVSKIVLAR